MHSKKTVLFLCTGNSARSQMAEALLRHYGGEYFEVYSAGTHPEDVHPKTIAALANVGIHNELHSKHIDALSQQDFDFVITLCDHATQECKAFDAKQQKLEWSFQDPKQLDQGQLGVVEPFQKVLGEISRRIQVFIQLEAEAANDLDDAPSAEQLALSPLQLFKNLSDDLRLKCLMLIQYEGELCVCELMAALDDSQPKISRHLALLRKSGLLIDRKLGQWVFYRINPALPAWAKSVLAETGDANVSLISNNLERLLAMGERPSRVSACCQA